jgi:DNA (cytosine-5)-methyltransferase 1
MLTKKQKQILNYIEKYIKKNDYSPSLQDIGKRFKLSSSATVHKHITNLREKGYLKNSKNQPRSIELNKKEKRYLDLIDLVKIPLLGTIAAGQPIEAIEDPTEFITIPKIDLPKTGKCYALRVKGDSMIDEGIFDNDIVLIKKQSTADNGQTVVAVIDQDQATLKKLYREKDIFRLQPANQNLLPIYTKELEIKGVVIKIIRELDNTEQKQYSTVDLFAGIGGIRLGFEKAGFTNDFEEQCKKTYDLNFKNSKLVVEDMRKIGINDIPEFDFLLGGFPCQAFSIAGHREGFNDKKGRGNLFFDIVRIIKARKPIGFFLENVKNLKNHNNGKTFKTIIENLEDSGYYIKTKVLNSMEYGNVPQNRERIYIVGFKNKEHFEKFSFPEKVLLTNKISNMLEKEVDKKYYYNDKPLFEKLKEYKFSKNKVYQWRRQYLRENKKGVCPTLTANMGTGGHNVPIIKDYKGIRKFTPRECARLQGFSDDFKLPKLADSSLYKQIGNSVSVTVVELVAKQIKKAII